MRIEWLKTALKNLDDEAAYTALDNPQAAADFVDAVELAAGQLAKFPAMGREGRLTGTREWAMPICPSSFFASKLACMVRSGLVREDVGTGDIFRA